MADPTAKGIAWVLTDTNINDLQAADVDRVIARCAQAHWVNIKLEVRINGGFETLEAARQWGAAFVHWYNLEHKHSGIRYVSPQQRHTGQDHVILAARHTLYTEARERNPARWARHTRDWSPMGPVTLNPERDCVIAEHMEGKLIQPLAA